MRFGILGPVEVIDGGGRVSLGGRRHLEVLALLLLDPGHPVSVDRILTELWGDAPGPGAVESLYTHVSNLRRVLGKERIVRDTAGYRLELHDGDEVDVQLFEDLTEQARRLPAANPATALERLESALELWRGRPFEGLEDLLALEPEIARLSELHAATETDRFEVILQSGGTPSVGEVEDLCRRRSLDERPWALAMRTLYRSGRQAEALRTYQKVRELFGEELGIEPSPRLMRLEEQILLHDPTLGGAPVTTPVHLPVYLTSFVGRARERAHLIDALEQHRLVTLTGPGGVGKTRLAIQVASSLQSKFPEGIWLIDLAKVADERGVGPAIASAVGASGGADVTAAIAAAALTGRRCLMILDNCEHVVTAARDAAKTLLTTATDLVLLATSRVALELAGEYRIGLSGLAISEDYEAPGEAMALFLDRARSIRPDLDVAERDAAAVASICRRLDGIPLALELAAARSDVLSPSEIADLLTRRFAVLVDTSRDREIHRSLEATVGWSFGLLEPEQRVAFAALGIFEGPFTADAARAVLGLEQPAEITVIEELIGASLVKAEVLESEGSMSYRLLDTLRLYARDRLTEAGMWDTVAQRHDDYYLEMCRSLADELLLRGRPDSLRRIARAATELTAAWDRMLIEDPVGVLPFAWALGNHWLTKGGIAEGEVRIRDLVHRTADAATGWRMLGLTAASWIADRRGFHKDAQAWSDEALALAEKSGDPLSVIVALNHAGQLRVDRGDHQSAIAMLERSLDEIARLELDRGPHPGNADGRAWAMVSLAEAKRWSGEPTPAVGDLLHEARRHFTEIGDPEGKVRADRVLVTMRDIALDERQRLAAEMTELANAADSGLLRYEAARATAIVSWDAGDRDRAMVMNRAAIRTAAESGSLRDLGSGLLYAGVFAGFLGHSEQAARLIGAGRQFCGNAPGPHTPIDLDAAVALVQRALGDDRFEQLRKVGSMIAPREALTLVLH
jgi:predicted ATPase/DNA-binding SARP family transcriptional activator